MTQQPNTKIRNWTGTVHYAINGTPACAPIATHKSWMNQTNDDVTCERCLSRFGHLHIAHYQAPVDLDVEFRERRAAELAARQAARKLA